MTLRECVGGAHLEGCEHRTYLQQGWERGIAHPRIRHAVALALAQDPELDPWQQADRVLAEMARAYAHLDGIDMGLDEWRAVQERQPLAL